MEFERNRSSSSVTESIGEGPVIPLEDDLSEAFGAQDHDLLESCDLFRQMTIETIKDEQNNVSEVAMKDKLTRTYQKLEDLKIDLLRLISDLEDTVTYNPFVGEHQSKLNKLSDGAPLYSSFIVQDDDPMMNLVDSSERNRLAALKNSKQNDKKRLAQLVEKMIY